MRCKYLLGDWKDNASSVENNVISTFCLSIGHEVILRDLEPVLKTVSAEDEVAKEPLSII